jgi:hypothetical protein
MSEYYHEADYHSLLSSVVINSIHAIGVLVLRISPSCSVTDMTEQNLTLWVYVFKSCLRAVSASSVNMLLAPCVALYARKISL